MPTSPTNLEDAVPRSIGRVLDLLELVLAEQRCTLTSAATASGLTPTTARRHLRALEARGYLRRDSAGMFSAGPTVLRMAAVLRDHGPLERLIASAQPHLDALARTTGESTYLAVSDGRAATYVATAESDRAIRHVGWVGQEVTLDGTAVGAALDQVGSVAARRGAVEPDITAVSLALGPLAGLDVAISIVGPSHRLDDGAIGACTEALTEAAGELRRTLGIDGEVLVG